MTAPEKATKWLTEHGYAQFKDQTWHHDGYEADAHEVLTEYIEEQCPNTQPSQSTR